MWRRCWGPPTTHNTAFYFIAWNETGRHRSGGLAQVQRGAARASISTPDFNNMRTLENNYQQDRDAMKLGDFTGIKGIPNQDIAMWETMGPIADRTGAARRQRSCRRRVPPSHGRCRARDASRRSGLGHNPAAHPAGRNCSYEGVVTKGTDWRSLRPGAGAFGVNGGARCLTAKGRFLLAIARRRSERLT